MFVETHKSEGNVFLTLFPAFIDKITRQNLRITHWVFELFY